ncbi:MAG: PilZ domain-containing protein [Pseudomonadota bacterium]
MKYRSHRFPTRFPVRVKVGAVGLPAMITSISSTGAGLSVEQPMAVGQRVKLSYAGGDVAGTICWSTQDRAGVTFARPLAKSELDRIRFGLRSVHTRPSHRVGFGAQHPRPH